MYRKAMLLGLLGYAAGCLIGLVIGLCAGEMSFREALPNILLGGIPGALAMGSSVVYGIEKWSILRATATHFVITMGALLFGGSAAAARGWYAGAIALAAAVLVAAGLLGRLSVLRSKGLRAVSVTRSLWLL